MNTIGQNAFFYCTQITSLILPSSLVTIDTGAFQYCTHLESINIPKTVSTISDSTFVQCTSLTSITLHNSISYIGSFAFSECFDLNTVIFCGLSSNNCKYNAFNECYDLKTIYVPLEYDDSTSDILCQKPVTKCLITGAAGDNMLWAFNQDNYALIISGVGEMYDFSNANIILLEDSNPWGNYKAQIKSVTIENGVESIGNNAFSGCTALNSITIENEVNSIGDNAFSGCSSLEEVSYYGTTEPTLGEGIFTSCDKLTVINVLESFESNNFAGKTIKSSQSTDPDTTTNDPGTTTNDPGTNSNKSGTNSNNSGSNSNENSPKLSSGAIAGIVIGGVVVVGAAIAGAIFLIKRKSSNKVGPLEDQNQDQDQNQNQDQNQDQGQTQNQDQN